MRNKDKLKQYCPPTPPPPLLPMLSFTQQSDVLWCQSLHIYITHHTCLPSGPNFPVIQTVHTSSERKSWGEEGDYSAPGLLPDWQHGCNSPSLPYQLMSSHADNELGVDAAHGFHLPSLKIGKKLSSLFSGTTLNHLVTSCKVFW